MEKNIVETIFTQKLLVKLITKNVMEHKNTCAILKDKDEYNLLCSLFY